VSILAPIKSRRTLEDLPPVATDDELVVWSQGLNAKHVVDLTASAVSAEPTRRSRPNRPLVAQRVNSTLTTDEILNEIEERATDVYTRRRVMVRRRALEGRTSTS
jgi:hypothetical protein